MLWVSLIIIFCSATGSQFSNLFDVFFFRERRREKSVNKESQSANVASEPTIVTQNLRNESPRSLQQSWALDHHNLAWYGLPGETARKHERWRKPESCSTSKSMRVSRRHGVWEVPDEPSPGRVDGGKLVDLWTTCLPLHWRERPVELFREPQRALDKLALSCGELVATQRRLPVRNDCGGVPSLLRGDTSVVSTAICTP